MEVGGFGPEYMVTNYNVLGKVATTGLRRDARVPVLNYFDDYI